MTEQPFVSPLTRGIYSSSELSESDWTNILTIARAGKRSGWREYASRLSGTVTGLLFLNPSLRTRVSFESGIARLGGRVVSMNGGTDTWKIEHRVGAVMNGDKAEHLREVARVLGGYCEILGVRSFASLESWENDRADTVVNFLRQELRVPLLNLESTMWHPFQAIADALTIDEVIEERGLTSPPTVLLTWANHPRQLPMAVPNSFALMAAQRGYRLRIACPEGYELSHELHDAIRATGRSPSVIEYVHDFDAAFEGVDVVYAKSWTPPMFIGRASDEMSRREELTSWCVSEKQMACTRNGVFMHCLPVRRNVVVSDDVLDGPHSVVERQAANRLHAQNGFLCSFTGGN